MPKYLKQSFWVNFYWDWAHLDYSVDMSMSAKDLKDMKEMYLMGGEL